MKYYQYKDEDSQDSIVCLLCKHYCTLKKDSSGICGINYNIDSQLLNKAYSHPSAIHLDPIEKKPLYHFLPSSTSLSIGTVGCNFRCPFCQNHTISQTSKIDTSIIYTPNDILNLALKHKAKSISYTYNEPAIWYPYAKDIGTLAKKNGIKNIFVSSGYESKEVISDMLSWVDALNIDLKSFSHEYYKKVLKTNLDGVLASLVEFARSDIWLEITTLLIPGVNDSTDEIRKISKFISSKLGTDVPWHLSAFHPAYKMLNTPNTSLDSLQKAKKIAQSYGIKYIYIGNIQNDNSTYCYKCGDKLIDRLGFNSQMIDIDRGTCRSCKEPIKGVWK